MGQRLNIEIVQDGKELANCYYHWSAYTSSAIELTKRVIDEFYDADAKEKGFKLAVKLLESTGAGINSVERQRIELSNDMVLHNMIYADCKDRNEGMIAVTPAGMSETRSWEEGRVTIDIGSETVCFDVMFYYDKDEYIEEYGDDIDIQNIRRVDFDFGEIPFEEFEELRYIVDNNPSGIKTQDGSYIQWIE